MMSDLPQFQDRTTALITGASSGIGYALAKVFARNGHNLVLVARNQERLSQLANEVRQAFTIAIRVIPIDLSVSTSPKTWLTSYGKNPSGLAF